MLEHCLATTCRGLEGFQVRLEDRCCSGFFFNFLTGLGFFYRLIPPWKQPLSFYRIRNVVLVSCYWMHQILCMILPLDFSL